MSKLFNSVRILPTATTKFFRCLPPRHSVAVPDVMRCRQCRNQQVYIRQGKLFGYCEVCTMRHYFFIPFGIQTIAHILTNKTILYFAGVSTGKTTGNAYSVIEHCWTTPGAVVYILAQNKDQRERVKRETLSQFVDEDQDFIKHTQVLWKFTNGSTISFYASDQHNKLKSGNATCIWLIEAQTFKVEIYFEASQRLRGESARRYRLRKRRQDEVALAGADDDDGLKEYIREVIEDRSFLIVEGNIAQQGWIRQFGIFRAHTVIASEHARIHTLFGKCKPDIDPTDGAIRDVVAIIASPMDNPINTEAYLTDIMAGKPKEWIDREIYADLSANEGLIYPEALSRFDYRDEQQPKDLTSPRYQWIEGLDFGGARKGNNETAYLLGIYEPQNGKVYFVAEYYQSGTNYTQDVEAIKAIRRMWGWHPDRARFFVCDPAGAKASKTDITSRTLINYYQEQGLKNLRPALAKTSGETSTKPINVGIKRVKHLLASGQLTFSDRCENTRKEFSNYQWQPLNYNKPTTVDKTRGPDHLMDVVRYMVMELPINQFAIDHYFVPKKVYNNAKRTSWGLDPDFWKKTADDDDDDGYKEPY